MKDFVWLSINTIRYESLIYGLSRATNFVEIENIPSCAQAVEITRAIETYKLSKIPSRIHIIFVPYTISEETMEALLKVSHITTIIIRTDRYEAIETTRTKNLLEFKWLDKLNELPNNVELIINACKEPRLSTALNNKFLQISQTLHTQFAQWRYDRRKHTIPYIEQMGNLQIRVYKCRYISQIVELLVSPPSENQQRKQVERLQPFPIAAPPTSLSSFYSPVASCSVPQVIEQATTATTTPPSPTNTVVMLQQSQADASNVEAPRRSQDQQGVFIPGTYNRFVRELDEHLAVQAQQDAKTVIAEFTNDPRSNKKFDIEEWLNNNRSKILGEYYDQREQNKNWGHDAASFNIMRATEKPPQSMEDRIEGEQRKWDVYAEAFRAAIKESEIPLVDPLQSVSTTKIGPLRKRPSEQRTKDTQRPFLGTFMRNPYNRPYDPYADDSLTEEGTEINTSGVPTSKQHRISTQPSVSSANPITTTATEQNRFPSATQSWGDMPPVGDREKFNQWKEKFGKKFTR